MTEVHPIEAHLINTPREIKRELYFSVAPNTRGDDMASICGRCDLEPWCSGIPFPFRKDAHISLDVPKIRNITSSDTSNCGIIPGLVAKKSEIQPGFSLKLGYSAT